MANNKPPLKLSPQDKQGRRIHIGDWVRLVEIPRGVKEMPHETRSVFQRVLGQTFKVEAFDEYGHAELDVSRKVVKNNWIWVEPEYLLLFRRKRKPGK